jgi:O-acetyl-ADP-ribose deacetylase (regulator of RNase III)
MIEERTGDLFAQPDLTALAHGCNCAGAMGAGIAVEFKRRHPAMYAAYKTLCAEKKFRPGDVFTWKAGPLTVFNLGTEEHWRKGATLDAIEQSVAAMAREADQAGIAKAGIPRIGAGYGGLKWEDVRAVIERATTGTNVTLVVVTLPRKST